jgi:hypothetical protein
MLFFGRLQPHFITFKKAGKTCQVQILPYITVFLESRKSDKMPDTTKDTRMEAILEPLH